MKRFFVCLIFFLLLICPRVTHAEMIFGVSPAKIEKDVLVNSIMDAMVTFSRSDASLQETFTVTVDGDVEHAFQSKELKTIILPIGVKEYRYAFSIDTHELSPDKTANGTVLFTLATHGTQSTFQIRPAIGAKIALHVLSEPTLFMRATDLGTSTQLPEGIRLMQLRVETDPQTKNKRIALVGKNSSEMAIKNLPYQLFVSFDRHETSLPSMIRKPIDAGESFVEDIPFDFSKAGLYHLKATIGTQTIVTTYRVWSQQQILDVCLGVSVFLLVAYLLFVVIQEQRKRSG